MKIPILLFVLGGLLVLGGAFLYIQTHEAYARTVMGAGLLAEASAAVLTARHIARVRRAQRA